MAEVRERPRPEVLLVDYGNVISRPQPPSAIAEMARLTGLDEDTFATRYWDYRLAYDLGGTAREFWSAVIGAEVASEDLLGRLVRADVASWSELNGDTLAVLNEAHAGGATLALLSNAPHELAVAARSNPALAEFQYLRFSATLGLAKPDPAVFAVVIEELQVRAGEVLFIDDRAANVRGAIDSGLQAVKFSSAKRLRSQLGL